MKEDSFLKNIDLSTAPKEVIELLIADAPEPSIFEEITRANINRPEILILLLKNPSTPNEIKQEVAKALHIPVKQQSGIPKINKPSEIRTPNMLQRIQKLSVSEKIHLALMGGREIRSILLRDPNKEVVLRVLENPRITEVEIELLTKSRAVSEEILRKITTKREWMKNYNIIMGLVTNPKTPAGIAVTLVDALKTKDLAVLSNNRNVLEGVRATAKKFLRARRAH